MSFLYIPAHGRLMYVCSMNWSFETMMIGRDLPLACTAPVSFPDGIAGAFTSLEQLFPDSGLRNRYGLSRPDNKGNILYQAAVGVRPEETIPPNMQRILLRQGKYAYFDIPDFMNNISLIGETFQRLTALPDIDPEGYCIEWYTGPKDLRCLIRLK